MTAITSTGVNPPPREPGCRYTLWSSSGWELWGPGEDYRGRSALTTAERDDPVLRLSSRSIADEMREERFRRVLGDKVILRHHLAFGRARLDLLECRGWKIIVGQAGIAAARRWRL